MSRTRRRLLIVSVIALVALGLAGAFFQTSTRQALERAEAFRFRRMLVTRQAQDEAYRFFYATNRRMKGEPGPIEQRFGPERQAALSFGRFDTEIETSLGIGMLIDPSDWFQNEEIRLRDVTPLGRDAFVEELRAQVQRSPHRSLLVNVNGFRERFESALRKTAFVGHVLDIDSPLLVFDWPGNQGSTPRGYRRAQQIAKESGDALAQMLALVIREIQPERLWLVANSMGGEVVVRAFETLHADPSIADAETEIEDVILTAPDVDHEAFGDRFAEQISHLTRNLTVYVSSNDRALLMSRVLNRGRRLGESTIDPSNPDQSDEALQVLGLVDPESDRVTLVDVTPVNRTRNFHNFSLETPEFFDDLYLRMVNPETPKSRLLYRVQSAEGRTYWVLTRGR